MRCGMRGCVRSAASYPSRETDEARQGKARRGEARQWFWGQGGSTQTSPPTIDSQQILKCLPQRGGGSPVLALGGVIQYITRTSGNTLFAALSGRSIDRHRCYTTHTHTHTHTQTHT